MEGTPPLRGEPYPVFKCGQNIKVKTVPQPIHPTVCRT